MVHYHISSQCQGRQQGKQLLETTHIHLAFCCIITTVTSLYLLVLGVLSTRTSVTSQWSPLGGGFGLSLEMADMVMPSSFSSSVEKHNQNLKAEIHVCPFILNVEQRDTSVLYPTYIERSLNGLYDSHIVVLFILFIKFDGYPSLCKATLEAYNIKIYVYILYIRVQRSFEGCFELMKVQMIIP